LAKSFQPTLAGILSPAQFARKKLNASASCAYRAFTFPFAAVKTGRAERFRDLEIPVFNPPPDVDQRPLRHESEALCLKIAASLKKNLPAPGHQLHF